MPKKKDWIEIVLHIAFWVGVFYTLSSLTVSHFKVRVDHNGSVMQKDVRQVLSPNMFLTLGFLALLFYGNIFWVFKKALRFKNVWGRVVVSAGWFLITFLANYYLVNILLMAKNNDRPVIRAFPIDRANPPPIIIPKDTVMQTKTMVFADNSLSNTVLLIFIGIFGLSVAYFFLKEWARAEKIRTQLEAVQLNTEVKFLKSQVNPHFLFNTLNNLFSMAQKKGNDDVADGISKLSDMMRYMIYESNAEQVPLKNEIAYAEDSILLNKLRYADDEAIVRFSYPAETGNIFVAPMLFIPFVENAFKHGVYIGQSSQIDISISLTDRQLMFTCQNTNYSFIKKMKADKSGIGLENVKRRLELVYPQKHKLMIDEEDGKFNVKLEIDLV